MKIAIAFLILLLTAGIARAQAEENPDPPPPDDVECPEGSIDMESNVCIVDPEEECPEGFESLEVGLGDICYCESGHTNNMGGCVTGNDDPNNDGCPPGYFAEGENCLPTDYADDLGISEDGCPEGYSPIGGHGTMCIRDFDDPCWDIGPSACDGWDTCPLGWAPQRGSLICFPACVFGYGPYGTGGSCNWSGYDGDGDLTDGYRAIITATDVTFFDYYGWGHHETFELDHSVGSECGPWETLIYGNCEALCQVYNVDCPTEEDPWAWIGYPRWPN